MLRFEHIELLYLLFLIPINILLYHYFDKMKREKLLKLGNKDIIEKLTKTISKKRRWQKRFLQQFAVIFLIFALANPQIGTKMEEVKREGLDILIALDVSYSMMAEDIAPNRLQKAKFEIREFIDRLKGDRIGIIPFAGIAFTQCPLTLDYGAAKMFLEYIDEYTIPEQGTNVGAAIETALSSFPTKERKYKVLVLITDGEDHESDINSIAKKAKEEGVRIYTVGIGSLKGVPIPVYDRNGNQRGFKKDLDGNIVTTKLDAETLKDIARTTSGKFYHVTPANSELDEITDEISTMESKELGSKEYSSYEDRFQYLLIFSILIMFIEILIPEREKLDQQWKGRFS